MMVEDPIPHDIKQFILANIDSVAQFEALLLLRAAPTERWSIAAVAKRRNYPVGKWHGVGALMAAFIQAFLSLMTPVILFGGMMAGVFTPTEAAFAAAVYALVLGLFVYREIKWRELPGIFLNTVETNAVVLMLVMTASLFGWVLARAQVPQQAQHGGPQHPAEDGGAI